MKRTLVIILSLMFVFLSVSYSQIDTTVIIKQNITPDSISAKRDSAKIRKDTVVENKFADAYYLNRDKDFISLNREQILLSDYFSFSDLLKNIGGYYISDLGNPGQLNPLFFQGSNSKNTSLLVDGIPYNNSFFGIPDQSLVMTEDIEKIEVLPVSQSLLFGNSNVINIITNKKNSNKPYTYVRHIEAPYDTYLTDGIFMRNLSSRSNLMAGFNYQTSDGRFDNSDYSFFGGRLRYRYILNEKMELNISDYFTKINRGLNGGVKLTDNLITDDSFNGDAAGVVFTESKEKYMRNLLNAQLSGFFFGDSVNPTLLTLSYNTEKDDLTDFNEELNQNHTQTINNNSIFISINQKLYLPKNVLSFYFSINRQSIDDFYPLDENNNPVYFGGQSNAVYTFSVGDNFIISDFLSVYASLRSVFQTNLQNRKKLNNFSFSINPKLHFSNFVISAEAAHLIRQPSFYENYIQNTSLVDELAYYSLSLKYNDDIFNSQLTGFFKNNIRVFLPGAFYNHKYLDFAYRGISEPSEIYGFSAKVNMEFGKILLESKCEFNHNTGTLLRKVIPEFSGYAGLYYYNRIFSDDIKIKIGLNGSYYSNISDLEGKIHGFYLDEYFTAASDYSPQGILNLFAALKIQTATIYLTIENLLDHNYFTTRVYPLNDRSFKLAVSWAFWD